MAFIGALVLPVVLPIFLPQFTATVLLIPIICFAIIPRTIFTMLMSSFLAKEKNFHNVIGNVITIILLIVVILVSHMYNSEIGVAYTFLIGTSGGAIYLAIVSFFQRKTKTKL